MHQSFTPTPLTGATRRHVGVVLRKLYVRNPCAPPLLKRTAGDGLDAIVDADDWQAQLGLERICLAQVRWATSGCVQTYRIGTYGRIEGIMTVSDLVMASEQDHESVKPLRKMYEFRWGRPSLRVHRFAIPCMQQPSMRWLMGVMGWARQSDPHPEPLDHRQDCIVAGGGGETHPRGREISNSILQNS